jgi:DNA modification methylase
MGKQFTSGLGKGDAAEWPRIEWAPIANFRPNPKNARTHSKKQIRQIAASIRQFDFLNPLIVDDKNMILAGHGRLEGARLEGMPQVPVIRFGHLSEAQKRAYVIADNKIAEQAGWDREMLAIELGELIDLLPVEGLDISLTGFETPEIDLLLADMASSRPDPEDALPTLPETAVTRRGDRWLLGKHRLLCGDAREPKDFNRAMSGARAAAVFTDPPYNLRVRAIGGRGRIKHPEFAFASGEMSKAQFRKFLSQTLGNGARVSAPGAVHFVCMDWRHIGELSEVGRELYGDMLNIVVWVKSNAGQGSFYRSQHEFIGVFRVGEEPHRNNVELGRFGRNRSNVWTYPGANTLGKDRKEALAAHPTAKPVALVADALLDCTARGDVVLDQFAGSGTTILAAEKVGRIAIGIEYEPRYVDVAILRWQRMTKLEAILASDGRSFEEINAARAMEIEKPAPSFRSLPTTIGTLAGRIEARPPPAPGERTQIGSNRRADDDQPESSQRRLRRRLWPPAQSHSISRGQKRQSEGSAEREPDGRRDPPRHP